jgi:hypothetical protein
VDVAAAAGNEGVDESRETRRLDPPGAGQQHDGPRRRSIVRRGIGSLRRWGLRLGGCGGGADLLGRGRAARGEHGLEVGDERGRERFALGSALAGFRLHRLRPPERLFVALSGMAWGRGGEREGEVYGRRMEGGGGVDREGLEEVGMD